MSPTSQHPSHVEESIPITVCGGGQHLARRFGDFLATLDIAGIVLGYWRHWVHLLDPLHPLHVVDLLLVWPDDRMDVSFKVLVSFVVLSDWRFLLTLSLFFPFVSHGSQFPLGQRGKQDLIPLAAADAFTLIPGGGEEHVRSLMLVLKDK